MIFHWEKKSIWNKYGYEASRNFFFGLLIAVGIHTVATCIEEGYKNRNYSIQEKIKTELIVDSTNRADNSRLQKNNLK